MSILIIEHQGTRRAGEITGRVLIGRWPQNTVVLEDRTVSRIHAWISQRDDGHYIVDATSRTGTIVNGEDLRDRRQLNDGDEIRIGPFTLKYQTDSAIPEGVETIDLLSRSASELSDERGGKFVDCVCGAPIWLPPNYVGMGRCRYCGRNVTGGAPGAPVPSRKKRSSKSASSKPGPPPAPPAAPVSVPAPDDVAAPLPFAEDIFDAAADVTSNAPIEQTPTAIYVPPMRPPPRAAPQVARVPEPDVEQEQEEKTCGVCHAPIAVYDESAVCPSCGLSFHGDCWRENRGCSSYGCDQVGALDTGHGPQ